MLMYSVAKLEWTIPLLVIIIISYN
jgi:hypothetical protein